MKKGYLKKIIILVFILLGNNYVSADSVLLADTIAPVIILKGSQTIVLKVGDTYSEQGYTATDDNSGTLSDLTAKVVVSGEVKTDAAGKYTLNYDVVDDAGNKAIQVIRIITVENITPIILSENFTIRNGDSIIWQGTVDLPSVGEALVNEKTINARSVLALLYDASIKNDSPFSISNLTYDESFGSFLLNCITPIGGTEACYNWQYLVDGVYPAVGMDKNILKGGESVYLFFGQPDQILLSSDKINKNENIIATTQKYDYENNTWLVKTGVEVSIIKVNPDDSYNPIEIQTGLVDENGQKTFSNIPIGLYSIGIKVIEYGYTYYWPQKNFEVTDIPPIENNSGSGGSSPKPKEDFSIKMALSFLNKNQKSDGSFGLPLYTDWVAIGVSQAGEDSEILKSKLKIFLESQEFKSSIITDYERHAMALMALGISPYNGTSVNYIEKIVLSFDQTQIGDKSLYNDDIFGLIVLANAGFEKDDEIIQKTIEYIISKQASNGSWGSVDMTSAAIQAISNFKKVSGVKDAISLAESFLVSQQKDNGGYDNSASTSWATQALSLNSNYSNNVDKGINYLKEQQESDGGLTGQGEDNRVWLTSYGIPAALKLSWNDILEDFSKEKEEDINSTEELNSESKIETILIKEEKILPVVDKFILNNEEEKTIPSSLVVKNINKVLLQTQKKENAKFENIIQTTEVGNLLEANAFDSTSQNNRFFVVISNIFNKIKAPFVWLWLHLLF